MKAKLLTSEDLEKKIAKALDSARIFDLDPNPDSVFAALLIVAFRRVLAFGGSPHNVAAVFYDLLANTFDRSGNIKARLPRLPKDGE